MAYFHDMAGGKKWLAVGSFLGGVVGAILLLLNEYLPSMVASQFGLQPGPVLSIALGMIGGMLGGVVGSLIGGAKVHEGVVLTIGESLGIGLLNGFLIGTMTGLAFGYFQTF